MHDVGAQVVQGAEPLAGHPGAEPVEQRSCMFGPVAEQCGGGHHHVGARQRERVEPQVGAFLTVAAEQALGSPVLSNQVQYSLVARKPGASLEGEPQANSTRPSDQRYAWVAVHSDLEVGFESANTIGRLLSAAIVRTTSSVKAPPTAATPMMAVGRNDFTASSNVPNGA